MAVDTSTWTKNPFIVNLRSNGRFQEGVPYAEFKTLRDEYPLYWNEEPEGYPGFWNVTRHEDVTAISLDTDTFCSGHGINMYNPREMPEEVMKSINSGSMITLDPPMHTAYRKVASPFFTLQAVQKLEGRIRAITTSILDDLADRDDFDFMTDLAAPLPIKILCDIMGVPKSDENLIFDWSNKAVGIEDPEFNSTVEDGITNIMQIFAYGQQMAEDRRQCPGDDLMSAMVHAEPEGDPIPQYLMDGFFLLMVIAGNETTRNSISGGMLALIENPDERKKLLDNPDLIPTGVEEILRWVSPVMHMRRTATKDTQIHGIDIAEGEKVVMWYPAANRDDRIFEDPETFNVTREPNDHIAFGIGRHRCLGARLGQLQLNIMFTELLERFPNMELNGPVRRMRTNFINGIKEMPVRVKG
jgi:cholest-4-en-3-one 26-monooxygenase